jgi:beta propeller repeat protein
MAQDNRQHLNRHVIAATLLTLVVVFSSFGSLAFAQDDEEGQSQQELSYRLVPGMTSSLGVDIRSLSASSQLIAWEDHRDDQPDIFVYNLNDARESRLSSTSEPRIAPSVSGSAVVWLEGEERDRLIVRMIDLAEDSELQLSEEPARIDRPVISSGLVAWQERINGRWFIQVTDRRGNHLSTFGEDGVNSARPDANDQWLVWQQHDGSSWNVHLYDVDTDSSRRLTDTAHDDQYPVLSDRHAVFIRAHEDGGAPQLIALDVETGDESTIVDGHFVQRPAAHGSLVVWEDWRSGLPDIYAMDLNTREMFAVARSQQAYSPVVSGSVVAWISGNDPSSQRVQALQIQERLPTDPQERPAVPSPDRLFIPETRHFVSGGFKSFWQANGGPQILGFPLTTEFSEIHEETGQEIVVQYFERVKLEYHPDAPEENRIRLSLLGHELRPESQTVPEEPFANDEMQRYFPETGHGVRFGFKEFWEANGGLELFGFPITGEFNEGGRTVQYFERARFEFDPESETGDVSLGLLGRESLQQRGWLPPPPIDTTQIFE